MSSHDEQRLGGFANLSAESLARLCYVSVRTARRWRRTGMAPRLAVEWLELIHRGDLSKIHSAWSQWCLHRDGTLRNEHGWQFTMHEVMSIPLLHSAVNAYRVEVKKLREKLTQSQAVLPPVTVTMTMQLPPSRLDEFPTFGETVALLDLSGFSATA